MRKCPDCEKEVDKYGFICEYCGKLLGAKKGGKSSQNKQPASQTPKENPADGH